MQKEFFLHQVCHQWLLYVLLLRLWPIMMTGFHKYTIFVFVVLVNFTPLFNLFGGPLSFHHAIDVQRLCREDLYTPSFGNFQDKLKVRAAEKSQAYDARRGVSVRKSLFRRKQSIPFQPLHFLHGKQQMNFYTPITMRAELGKPVLLLPVFSGTCCCEDV